MPFADIAKDGMYAGNAGAIACLLLNHRWNYFQQRCRFASTSLLLDGCTPTSQDTFQPMPYW
jgi:hypothetical protein